MRALFLSPQKTCFFRTLRQQNYAIIFQDEVLLDALERRQAKQAEKPDCVHTFTEAQSLDDSGNEQICQKCGEVGTNEIPEAARLTGGIDPEDWWRDISWGPATPIALESFLVPTLRRIKCRDRYVDIKILAKLRSYTAIQRLCEQHHIPKRFADEVMTLLLKRRKGLYSKYDPVRLLCELIKNGDPRLHSRLAALEPLAIKPRPQKRGVKKTKVQASKVQKKRGRPRKTLLESLMLVA